MNLKTIEDLKFTLRGVKITKDKKMPKFSTKRPHDQKISTKTRTRVDYSGHRIVLAYSGNVEFNSETDSNLSPNCWWDHHCYDTFLICVPIKYHIKGSKHIFSGPGSFCSMFCLRAYLRELQRYSKSQRPVWLETAIQNATIAFSLMYPSDVQLKPAPDWRLLEAYSGKMSINEFRKASCNKTYIRTPNICFKQAESLHIVN